MKPLLLVFVLGLRMAIAAAAPLPGQLLLDPENPQALVRAGGGHVFICGPGDPEDFLYRGERNADGTRRGDQVELIEKLARHGGNCVYLQAVRTHGGDAGTDRTHNPFIDSDPAKGLDDRILAQWEQWFALMDRHEILIYFEFYDDSARIWDTGDAVGEPERRFFEALVRRFQHHRNLIWLVGEEVDERYSPARVRALADVIRTADTHGHIIGSHHLAGTTFRAWEAGSALSHFSMQLNLRPADVHVGALAARAKAENRYQVFYAENTATPKDDDSQRRHAWTVAMAGIMPMMLQMDIAGTSVDLLAQCRVLQRFFERSDFATLSPHDEFGRGATRYVLADPGRSYIAYSDRGCAVVLAGLPAGHSRLIWVDCRTGRTRESEQRQAGGEAEFARPEGFADECALWVQFPDITRTRVPQPAAVARRELPRGPNQSPAVANERIAVAVDGPTYVQLRFVDEDGPGPYRYTIVEAPKHGKLAGTDNDRTYAPRAGFRGVDTFAWKVSDGAADSAVARVTLVVGEGGK